MDLNEFELPVRPATICSTRAFSSPDVAQSLDILAFYDMGAAWPHEQIAVFEPPLLGRESAAVRVIPNHLRVFGFQNLKLSWSLLVLATGEAMALR